jgi:hypothetical protein
MPGVLPYIEHGPATYATMTTISGGQLVAPDLSNPGFVATNTAAGSKQILGVAGSDAGVRTNQYNQNPVNLAQQPDYVAVYYNVDIPVKYSGAAEFGDYLMADSAGGVISYTAAGAGVVAPPVPASTVVVTNTTGYSVTVVLSGGTYTVVTVNGSSAGTGGTYTLPAGQTISITYSVAPTWVWTATETPATFDQIVGKCTEPAGVAAAGTVARAWIGGR